MWNESHTIQCVVLFRVPFRLADVSDFVLTGELHRIGALPCCLTVRGEHHRIRLSSSFFLSFVRGFVDSDLPRRFFLSAAVRIWDRVTVI